jgi:hypothetical protein
VTKTLCDATFCRSTLYAIHEKSKSSRTSLKTEEKFRKQHDKMYLSELERRLQCCLRKIPIACEAVQVAKPPGESTVNKIIKKMEAIFLPSTILMVTKVYLTKAH